MAIITVRHNIEVAHRLYLTAGKCENIHGHSMWVDLSLRGRIHEPTGMLTSPNDTSLPYEFGNVKKSFREFLDSTFDHHLLLNSDDPWAGKLTLLGGSRLELPGLMEMPGDPTTENIAKWIAEWACSEFKTDVDVSVEETAVNSATVTGLYYPDGTKVVVR